MALQETEFKQAGKVYLTEEQTSARIFYCVNYVNRDEKFGQAPRDFPISKWAVSFVSLEMAAQDKWKKLRGLPK